MPVSDIASPTTQEDVINLVKRGTFAQLSQVLQNSRIGKCPENEVLHTINQYLMIAYTTAIEAAIAEPWDNLAERREYLKKAGAIAFHNREYADDKKDHNETGALGLWERNHALVLTVQKGDAELFRHFLEQEKDSQHELLNAPVNGGKVSHLLFIAATRSEWALVADLMRLIYADGANPACSQQLACDEIIAKSNMNDGARIVLQSALTPQAPNSNRGQIHKPE